MGMDVYGKNATTETGEYFRRNVWGWHPLWSYVENIHPDIAEKVEHGHSNDGDGLNAEDSAELAKRLRSDLEAGLVLTYIAKRNEWLSELPREKCNVCEGTGIRTDAIGREYGHPEKELAPEIQILTGRTHGYCNGCSGCGDQPNWETHYSLDTEDLKDFADFLADCGGFEIC